MIKKAIKKSFLIIVFWLLRLLGLRESDLIKPLLLLSYNPRNYYKLPYFKETQNLFYIITKIKSYGVLNVKYFKSIY